MSDYSMSDTTSTPEPGSTATHTNSRNAKAAWLSRLMDANEALIASGDDRALTGTDCLVLIAVAGYAGDCDLDNAWPSVATIRRKTGAGESTIRRTLSRLRRNGWLIERQRGGQVDSAHKSTVYALGPGPALAGADDTNNDTPPLASDRVPPPATERVPPPASERENDHIQMRPGEVTPTASAQERRQRSRRTPKASADKPRLRQGRSTPPRTINAEALTNPDVFEAWIEHHYGLGPYSTGDDHDTFQAVYAMWCNGRNWRAILNYVEKHTGYPHQGEPLPVPPAPYVAAA